MAPAPAALRGLQVYVLDLGCHRDFGRYWEILGDAEQQRAAGLRKVADREGFVLAHAALRLLASTRLQCAPADVTLSRGEHGRPVIVGTTLEFSLSRTDGAALLALRDGDPIGVDVEADAPVPDALRLADFAFSGSERRLVEAVRPEIRSRSVLRLWTRKEALAKAAGTGIGSRAWRTSLGSIDAVETVAVGEREFLVSTLDIGPAHHAAVAAQRVPRVRPLHFPARG